MSKKKKKVRTELRKNRGVRTRRDDWTRRYETGGNELDDARQTERVSGKGEMTRKRTIVTQEADPLAASEEQLDVDESRCLAGRVLRVHGLLSEVHAANGRVYQCAIRGLLKRLETDERHVVAAGDRVLIDPAEGDEGFIVRVEPRHGVLSRTSRGRQHVVCTNVDQMAIVTSAAEPRLKPHLIDRMLISAEKGGLRPLICINKIDLIDPASLEPLVGVYSQIGYRVSLLSAKRGAGVERLRRELAGRETVLAGQSGVGKSSLLNAIEPGLGLRVARVSAESQKGRHTTTVACLLPLEGGGYVVDTPGIRQFQLWDVIPEEVAGYCPDLRPFVNRCRFPNCTHVHEEDCAVKDAVADDLLDVRRYESYLQLFAGEEA